MTGSILVVRCERCGAENRMPSDKAHRQARCGRCGAPLAAEAGWSLTVTETSFESDVLAAPVLVDFWAPWCGPCRALAPAIEALATAYAGRMRVAKVNVDDNPALAARYGIQGIPALVFFVGGRPVDRLVGLQPRAAIERCLLPLLARTATGRGTG